MDTPQKPKKKQNLAKIGGLLIFGGIIVLRQAGSTGAFYENTLHEDSGASWATGLAWLMILGGGGLLLTGLAKHFGSSE